MVRAVNKNLKDVKVKTNESKFCLIIKVIFNFARCDIDFPSYFYITLWLDSFKW